MIRVADGEIKIIKKLISVKIRKSRFTKFLVSNLSQLLDPKYLNQVVLQFPMPKYVFSETFAIVE